MHNLGYTRSARKADHLLLTPDTFIRTALPGMKSAVAVVHASPAVGASFTMYTVEFEPHGELGDVDAQRFVFVLTGSLQVLAATKQTLGLRNFLYLPQGGSHRISATEKSTAIVIEKKYMALPNVKAPDAISGDEQRLASSPIVDDDRLQVKYMLPDNPSFDFAVNTLSYAPGASLPVVEMHIMEHGLVMLEGGGIYRLGDDWYSVTTGDFIYMAPWCPQWFGAIGKTPAKYLIYKDWNRYPVAGSQK